MTRWIYCAVLLLGACDDGRPVSADGASGDGSVADGAATDGGGADGPALPACGDPDVMARFADCVKADDEKTCKARGGNWTPIGLYPEPLCICPTGQEGCSCSRASDCVGACRAEMPVMWDCSNIKPTCAPVAPHVGCWCWVDELGNASGMCAD